MRVLYERCAGLDVDKDRVTATVRGPGQGPGGRTSEVCTFRAYYGALREMVRWLMSRGVTRVAMEATGMYSMPVYHALLEYGDFEQVLVCNAGHIKNVPGRKTDAVDSDWIAQLLECGLLTGSYMPEQRVQQARDAVRYRKKLVGGATSETQRLGGVLQDAGIKLDSVASSILTASGRDMIEALIDGERRGLVLAELAQGRMRPKIPDLAQALQGRFDEHHALMCRLHLDHIDHLNGLIAQLDAEIEQMMVPFAAQRALMVTIPGIGPVLAAAVLAEIGPDPAQFFADAAHLASWTGLCPGNHESAGKRKHGKPHKANQHVKPLLIEAAWAAVRTRGRLQAQYRRLVRRFGGWRNPAAKQKAIIAVAHTLIVIIYHVLSTHTPYTELGEDFYTRRDDPAAQTRRLIAQLEALGNTVTVEPTAA